MQFRAPPFNSNAFTSDFGLWYFKVVLSPVNHAMSLAPRPPTESESIYQFFSNSFPHFITITRAFVLRLTLGFHRACHHARSSTVFARNTPAKISPRGCCPVVTHLAFRLSGQQVSLVVSGQLSVQLARQSSASDYIQGFIQPKYVQVAYTQKSV